MNYGICKTGKTGVTALLIAGLFCISAFVSSCGGGGGGSHANTGGRVTAQVLVQNAALAKINGITAERSAEQAGGCSTVPTGYAALTDATITISDGDSTTTADSTYTATTDSNGCFTMEIGDMSGVVVFTATKTNAAGGTTTLKKSATLTLNASASFVSTSGITELSTVAAIIVEQKMEADEDDIDPEAIEAYVNMIQEQENIQQLVNSIAASAGDPNAEGFTAFSDINTTTLTEGEQTTDKPVFWSASVNETQVSSLGGDTVISVKVATYGSGKSISTVTATLMPVREGGTSHSVTMTADSSTANLYTGTHTFSATTLGTDTEYFVSFSATDSGGASNSYTPDGLRVTQLKKICGNSVLESGEMCDDGNTDSNDGCSSICNFEWTLQQTISGQNTETLGTSVASAGDVDGDGKNEIIVGATAADFYAGKAYLYDDNGTTLLATISGGAGMDYLGQSVSSAGDVDGDGKAELLIGAYGARPGGVADAGSAYLYDDNGTTLLATINGAAANEYLGISVASAGDVDGDGKAELLIGAQGVNSYAGAVYLYDDNGTTVLATMNGKAAGDFFGASVASAGDVDGDGKPEFLIGAQGANGGAGAAYLYDDNGSTLLATINGETSSSLGVSVSSAGDVDGDGKAELLIGAYRANNKGAAYLYDDDGSTVLATLSGSAMGDYFGQSVASAGDVDGDGKAEILIGAPSAKNSDNVSTGAVYLYDHDGYTLLASLYGTAADDALAYCIAAIGDVDGDGKGSFIAGAYGANSRDGSVSIYD